MEGYTTQISGDARSGYVIINTHTPADEPEPDKEEPGPVIGNPDDDNHDTQAGPGPEISNPDGSNPDSTGGTQTGDVSMTYLWILLMIAAAAVVSTLVIQKFSIFVKSQQLFCE